MVIRGNEEDGDYSQAEIAGDQLEALTEAAALLIDEIADDLLLLERGEDIQDTSLVHQGYLPQHLTNRYDVRFVRRFLTCLVVVGWKLGAATSHQLCCTAEELALNAIVLRAESLLESQGLSADFSFFNDIAFEDGDYEYLFDPSMDGLQGDATGKALGIGGLEFPEWFQPFGERVVHPYVLG